MSLVEPTAGTAVALIDGEHYHDVTAAALEYARDVLRYELLALVFLGGTEKLSGESADFGALPVYTGSGQVELLRAALSEHEVEFVLDLSDEPVVGYRERFRLISEALARGVSYRGPDFEFAAPRRPFLCEKPCVGVWGSGKRVGKTAVAGYFARLLAADGCRPCVLTMGRGGPPEPELLDSPASVTDGYLLDRAREGCHAASDHFEDAMMAGVTAVGTRRCGGGMAGEPFFSNVPDGALLACSLDCDVIICEGSGAAVPPVGVDSVLMVVSATQPHEYLLEYLGRYRLLLSDLVLVTMCDDFQVSSDKLRRLKDGIQSINPGVKVLEAVFRPRPLGDLGEGKVFLTSTASGPAVEIQASYLGERYGARVVGWSSNLADRKRLEEDLGSTVAAEADVLVTELKAAGVDTVSVLARNEGKRLVYMDNFPVPLEGNLEEELRHLVSLARGRCLKR